MGCLVVYLIVGLVCGFVSKSINENRGGEGGFWWGFLLGVIGIVVVAVRPMEGNATNLNSYQNQAPINSAPVAKQNTADELKKYKELLDQGVITEEEYQTKKEQLLKTI